MKTLQIKDGDFVRGSDNRWVRLEGLDAVRQRIEQRLRLFRGEWFMDKSEGIDWIGVFQKPFSLRKMRAEIINALSKDEAISSLDNIDIIPDFSRRLLTIDVTLTADGEKLNITRILED
jgi:hypothetical protein